MPVGSNIDQAQKLAAGSILETPNLTDELTDKEAQPLLEWGLAQAQAAVPAGLVRHFVTALPGDDRREALLRCTRPVRRVVRVINTLTGVRHSLALREVSDELAYILDLSRQLPLPPARPVTRTALAELAAWQKDMDNGAFVWAILTLLGEEPPPRGRPTDRPEIGDTVDRHGDTGHPSQPSDRTGRTTDAPSRGANQFRDPGDGAEQEPGEHGRGQPPRPRPTPRRNPTAGVEAGSRL
jgi:hypothetical protein